MNVDTVLCGLSWRIFGDIILPKPHIHCAQFHLIRDSLIRYTSVNIEQLVTVWTQLSSLVCGLTRSDWSRICLFYRPLIAVPYIIYKFHIPMKKASLLKSLSVLLQANVKHPLFCVTLLEQSWIFVLLSCHFPLKTISTNIRHCWPCWGQNWPVQNLPWPHVTCLQVDTDVQPCVMSSQGGSSPVCWDFFKRIQFYFIFWHPCCLSEIHHFISKGHCTRMWSVRRLYYNISYANEKFNVMWCSET